MTLKAEFGIGILTGVVVGICVEVGTGTGIVTRVLFDVGVEVNAGIVVRFMVEIEVDVGIGIGVVVYVGVEFMPVLGSWAGLRSVFVSKSAPGLLSVSGSWRGWWLVSLSVSRGVGI